MRFNTDTALFDAFPTARDHIGTGPRGVPPTAYVDELVKASKFDEALSFCSYLLARREAVAWGCRCWRSRLVQDAGPKKPANPGLVAAESWAEAPSDKRRLKAYDCWIAGDRQDPATWFALATAWSGGNMIPGLPNSPFAAPHLTATLVRVGLLLMLYRVPASDRPDFTRQSIGAGLRLAAMGLS